MITEAESESNIRITIDPHISPLRASYGVSIVGIFLENSPRYNGTALYDTTLYFVKNDGKMTALYATNQWLSASLQYLQCVSNGDTAVLH